jgi:HD-like signal output (HDOD) protein
MPQIALGTTTIENIVAHDAAALEKDLANTRADASVALPGVPQIVTRLQQLLSDPDVSIPQIVPVITNPSSSAACCRWATPRRSIPRGAWSRISRPP